MLQLSAMKRICVFCGSSGGIDPVYMKTAAEVGAFLASRGIELVYGGGRVGLMGRIADSVLANGGKVIGVIPEALAKKEIEHEGLTELYVVNSMHERKAMMAEFADGFIAMPGGKGYFNATGNPGMATGGSGDVLTGLLTSLLAQGYSSGEAALLGVYLHGLAGDLAAREGSEESLIASDLPEYFAMAFKSLR